tara:strand:+ start:299 stop:580 length:282 start_codon:yes stop_codon:yes gene_type:complete
MDKLLAINALGCGPVAVDADGKVTPLKNQQLPSDEAINAKITELQAEYEANEYQRQRAAEYPSWEDQLDKIYHHGVNAWKAEIKAIKDKYPKP